MLQSVGFGDANSVLRRCGPHKLAKAFASCIGKAATASQPLPLLSPGLPYGTLASPQSLFRSSPEDLEHRHRVGHVQHDYFPLTTLSRANEPLVPVLENAHAEKRKPRLLLVEDNRINLQVPRSWLVIAAIMTHVCTASLYLGKEEPLRVRHRRKWLQGAAGV